MIERTEEERDREGERYLIEREREQPVDLNRMAEWSIRGLLRVHRESIGGP